MARLDTIAAWLQREDDELLYDPESVMPAIAALDVEATARDAMRTPQPATSLPTGADIAGMVLADVHRRRALGMRPERITLAVHPDWYAVLLAWCAEQFTMHESGGERRAREDVTILQLYGVQIVPDARIDTYRFLG